MQKFNISLRIDTVCNITDIMLQYKGAHLFFGAISNLTVKYRIKNEREPDMQLQMTTDYALRILVYLASEKRVVSSTELSKKLVISAKYVPHVGDRLRGAGLVNTVAGKKGGYILSKPFADISVYDIIVAIEGAIKLNRCLEADGHCNRHLPASCVIHHLLAEVQQEFENKLKSETLETLLAKIKSI